MKKIRILVLFLMVVIVLSSCEGVTFFDQEEGGLHASGVVEALEISVSSELPGRVIDIYVRKGDSVEEGDALFMLDGDILKAQHEQATAAYNTTLANEEAALAALTLAEAVLDSAQAGYETSRLQYQIVLTAARFEEKTERENAWDENQPNEFNLPAWYFTKDEDIEAAHAEIAEAFSDLEEEQENYADEVKDLRTEQLAAAEERLAKARLDYVIIQELLERNVNADAREDVTDYLKSLEEAAKNELESAQLEYDQLLDEEEAETLLEARARVEVAQEKYETALDHLAMLLTGSDSLEVRAALAVVAQAEAGVSQAEAGITQAEAAVTQAEQAVEQAKAQVDIIELQMERLTIYATISGTVMASSVDVGENIQPGQVVMTIGKIDDLTVKVFVPEDRYGEILLGDVAKITADSFPDLTFEGEVIRIADQAEYTPRNVQTEEERRTTVFAIELSIEETDGKLKPGMPVSVEFE
jgi:multidrug resistance efflux pump